MNFSYYVAATNANPNGDPDMGNTPRIDPETMQGFITDVATKRRIRNYIQTAFEGQPGMNIIVQQSTNFKPSHRPGQTRRRRGGLRQGKDAVYAYRRKACELYYDVRTFGAVMSTGPNAGQVRGAGSDYLLEKAWTLCCPWISPSRAWPWLTPSRTARWEDYLKKEAETPEDKLRTMGRKQLIPFGLYEVRGFVSANLAAETGFDNEDLHALFEAILNMYEHDHSASKGRCPWYLR